MATVSATLQVFDSMSNTIRNITNSLNSMVSTMGQVQNAMSGGIPGAVDRNIHSEQALAATLNTVTEAVNRNIRTDEALVGAMNRMENAAISNIRADEALVGTMNQISAAQSQIVQSINSANQAQQRFNRTSSSGSNMLLTNLKGLVAAYVSFRGVQKGMEISDSYISAQARLKLINDKSQSGAQLQDKIFAAADRARGDYSVMTSSVGKLGLLAGNAFYNNNEIIRFTELMQKSFKVGGSSTMEQQAGMYQLTQAMASGRLQGDEFRTIRESAPMLANAIANFTGKSAAQLKQMSADGTITADIIKGALFNAANDINHKFETLPMTFSDVATKLKNTALRAFGPVIERVNQLINSPGGAAAVNNITNAINMAAAATGWLINNAIWLGNVMQQSWGMIVPVIWMSIGALIMYNGQMLISMANTAKDLVLKGAHAIALWAEQAATVAVWIAQDGLNAALYACPLTWVIGAIIILIAIFYLAIATVNHFAGTSYSATGIIAGAFTALGSIIYNVVASIWNFWASFVEFFANVFYDPVYSIKKLFVNLANSVLSLVKSIASAMDAVFGSSLSGSVQALQNQMQGWLGEMPEGYKVLQRMEMRSIEGAYMSGYNWGSNLFNLDNFKMPGFPTDFSAGALPNINKVNEVGKINDTVDISSEDLRVMRDLAEMKSIQNFVTLTPTVSVQTGDIRSEADIDTLVRKIQRTLEDELASSAAGSYS